jgi:hypothetical protein
VKIVINKCYGGYGLSEAAYEELHKLGVPILKYDKKTYRKNREKRIIFEFPFSYGSGKYFSDYFKKHRGDKDLVEIVERLGEKANGLFADLEIEEVEGKNWRIENNDGWEKIV